VNVQNQFDLASRRYIGNKQSLTAWIFENIPTQYRKGTFWDVFAGTASVGGMALETFDKVVLSDHLWSNEVVYQGFFGKGSFRLKKLDEFVSEINSIKSNSLSANYFSRNFGNKYFDNSSAKKIGFARETIEENLIGFSKREKAILITSLIYSMDRVSNPVGHYEAFMQTNPHFKNFEFRLINPLKNAPVEIYREDANDLARKIQADVAYLDPPYNSRQYSRFYHVLETLTKWDKPKLTGVAMKPPTENSSVYCKVGAQSAFQDLVENISSRLIIVSYNNTYLSKSSSSQNRIQLEDIESILKTKGSTKVIKKPYKAFSAGNTDFADHHEYLFITKVAH
jgi:adenine-specific DNA-methyltransferase